MRRIQAGPQTWYPIEHQHPRHFDAVAPYTNQDQTVANSVDTALIVPNRAWGEFVPPQPMGIQNYFGYAPDHQRAGPSNAGFPRAPTFDASMAEGRRRLAGHYINDASAYVSMIRLEPSASGQFQVIITLEMANVL
ncbi:hypothetical protein V8E53_011088 [Lactarius tabidus]